MLAHHTVPVWGVLFVEKVLDVLRDLLLSFLLVDSAVDLLLNVVLHLLLHFANDPCYTTLCHSSSLDFK